MVCLPFPRDRLTDAEIVLVNNARNRDRTSITIFGRFKNLIQRHIRRQRHLRRRRHQLLPLPFTEKHPRVINISSGRASLQRSVSPKFLPTAVAAYSISKGPLNCLAIEAQKAEDARTEGMVGFYIVNPGHCKTALNGYKGTKDPLDGANMVVRLVAEERWEWKTGSFLGLTKGK
jgi:hypothetical protein